MNTTPVGSNAARTGAGAVYIAGCPRSGTYLLALLLGCAFDIAIPVETHFIPLFERVLFLFGDLREYANRRRLLMCIYDFLEIWTPRSERDRDWRAIRRHSLLATRTRQEAILDNARSYPELVTGLYREFAAIADRRLYGDKSAFYRHVALERIEAGLPGLRLIHIIRDGRDVALSWLGIWTRPATLAEAAREWARHVEGKRAWGRRHPERYLEVRYEDLLSRPEEIQGRIAAFLGLPVPLAVASFHTSELAATLASGSPHSKIASPLDPGNIAKWRRTMCVADQALFEALAGTTLSACGYESGAASLTARQRLTLKLRVAWGKIRRLTSVQEFRLLLKAALPLALFLASLFHLPLARLLNHRKWPLRDGSQSATDRPE